MSTVDTASERITAEVTSWPDVREVIELMRLDYDHVVARSVAVGAAGRAR